jgi:hypothetical protein
MLETGNIPWSKSAASILVVPKVHRQGRDLYVDYRGNYTISIPNRYPVPLMTDLDYRVYGRKILTNIDLKHGDYFCRINKGEK